MTNNKTNESAEPAPVKRKGSLCLRILGVLFVLLVIALVAAVLYPAPILRVVFSRVEAETGIAVTFDQADLNLGKHRLLLSGLTAKQQNPHAGHFDLKAEKVYLFFDLFSPSDSLFFDVYGLRGTYEITGNDPAKKAGNRPEPGQAVGFALAQTPSVVGLDESSSGISNRLQYKKWLPTSFPK